mgnify:FL=1
MQLTIEQEMHYVDTVSPYYWLPAIIVGVIMFIYSLVHAIIITDGFVLHYIPEKLLIRKICLIVSTKPANNIEIVWLNTLMRQDKW